MATVALIFSWQKRIVESLKISLLISQCKEVEEILLPLFTNSKNGKHAK
jgi:hypothetical protein